MIVPQLRSDSVSRPDGKTREERQAPDEITSLARNNLDGDARHCSSTGETTRAPFQVSPACEFLANRHCNDETYQQSIQPDRLRNSRKSTKTHQRHTQQIPDTDPILENKHHEEETEAQEEKRRGRCQALRADSGSACRLGPVGFCPRSKPRHGWGILHKLRVRSARVWSSSTAQTLPASSATDEQLRCHVATPAGPPAQASAHVSSDGTVLAIADVLPQAPHEHQAKSARPTSPIFRTVVNGVILTIFWSLLPMNWISSSSRWLRGFPRGMQSPQGDPDSLVV